MSRKKVICLILILIIIAAMALYYVVDISNKNTQTKNDKTEMAILTFGDSEYDGINDLKTIGDGYIAVGYTSKKSDQVDGELLLDGAIVKYDKNKKIVFEKKYDTGFYEKFESVIVTKDGYIVVGNIEKYDEINVGGVSNAFIVKYDFNGNILWDKKFNTTTANGFNKIISVSDGYIVVGRTHVIKKDIYECINGEDGEKSCSYLDAGKDNALIVKYDFNGNVLWQKEFGDEDNKEAFKSVAMLNDGYVAVGSSNNSEDEISMTYPYYSAIAVKYDFKGNVVWNKNYSDSKFAIFNDVVAVKNDNYKSSFVVAGAAFYKENENICGLMARIDDKGKVGFNVQHSSAAGSETANSELLSVSKDNNEFMGVGYSNLAGNSNIIVSKNTVEGINPFGKTYDYFKFDRSMKLNIISNNGNYIISGTSSKKDDSKYADLFKGKDDGFILFDSVE
jgi:hypothetical protein